MAHYLFKPPQTRSQSHRARSNRAKHNLVMGEFAHKGQWVYLQGHSFNTLLNPDNWASTLTSLASPGNDSLLMGEDLAESEESSFRSLSLLFYLVEFKAATITTGNGKDARGCGQSSLPCSSVDEAWLHLKDSPRVLVISTSSQLDSELTLNEANIEMRPTSGTETIRIGKTGSFLLSTHSLSPSSLSFVPVVATETRDSSLFSIVGGSLTMTSCSFAGFCLSSVALIDHSGKTLKMSDVEFKGIVRMDGNGSVIDSELVSGMKLDLNNIGMVDVSSRNGDCDGIFVRFGSKSTPLSTPEFNLTNLHFSASSSASLSTSSNTDEVSTCFLWIEGDNLGSIISEGDSRFTGSYSGDSLDPSSLWTHDWTSTLSSSLLFYLREKRGAVGLDTLGIRSPHCGFFTVWCPTLSDAIDRLPSAVTTTVQVQSSIALSEPVTFSSMRTLCGVDSESTVTIESTCSFSVSESSSVVVTISSLRFLLPSSLDADQLFLVSGGTLKISSCSFSPETATPFSFQLICGSANKVIVESTNVSSASLSSVALIGSSCEVSISDSRFSSIVVSEGHGSVLQADVNSSCPVSVVNTVLTDCSNSDGGSAILLMKGTGGSFSVDDWEGTFDLSSDMGAVLVLDPSQQSSHFNPCSLLYEFYPRKPNEIVVRSSTSTIDHPLCGNASLACHSISVGRELTGVEKIVIVESGRVEGRMEMNGESLSISGKKGKERMEMVGEGQIVDKAHTDPDNLTIEKLVVDVSLTTLSSSSALFVLEMGKIEISDTSFESSEVISCQLISVLSGDVNLHEVTLSNLVLTHPSPVSIASSSNCTLHIVVVDGISNTDPSITPSPNTESDTLCSWSSGFLSLSNTTAHLFSFTATNVSHGALFVSNSSVSIEGGIFRNNSAFCSDFPSANRNIRCVNSSSLTIDSLNGGDGFRGSSAWMSVDDDCVLSGVDSQPTSPLFVPTLSNESKSTLMKKEGLLDLNIVGSTLIPCDLSLEVFEMTKEKKEG
ncbi:hypothetical protein BLNAU_18259 [Blattamonas nauphoetae]|uniref:Uncharacterized protein n=1 Tax=Blattamonas nauphoetae TaxID=2049346 RepID=A0ABQ9X4V6_9EUKA|nr:hypothetical protein BLNAU_18259 [Blattamonas nauphoetae]